MTAAAVPAEAAGVDVIPPMAVGTLGRYLDLVGYPPGVAGHALQAGVGTVQGKIRLPGVIKSPQVPVVRVVAGAANGTDRKSVV